MQLGDYIAIALGIISGISAIIAIVIYNKIKKAKTKQDGYEEHIKEYLSFDEFRPVLLKSIVQPYCYYARLKDDDTIEIIYKPSLAGNTICQENMGFKEFKDKFYLKDIDMMKKDWIAGAETPFLFWLLCKFMIY